MRHPAATSVSSARLAAASTVDYRGRGHAAARSRRSARSSGVPAALAEGSQPTRRLGKATPLIHDDDIVERILSAPKGREVPSAFFSTELRGITTNPAFMMVHLDDHIVHRGHGVFDTLPMVDGHLFQLEYHLDRLEAGCRRTRIDLPLSREDIRRVVLHTAAASKALNGTVRMWASAGRGDFSVAPTKCPRGSFYCIVVPGKPEQVDVERGWHVSTASVRQGSDPTTKTTTYLNNALAQMEAEDKGCDTAIFTDVEGFVTEGPTMNVAMLTTEGELVFPPFTKSLPGAAARRVMELVEREMANRKYHALEGIKSVSQRDFTVEEAKGAAEVMCVGSTIGVIPVTHWDEHPIGDGTGGLATVALRALLQVDMEEIGPEHTEVPYGYLTGMRGL